MSNKRAIQLTVGEVGDLEVLIRSRIEHCADAALRGEANDYAQAEIKEYRAEARRLAKLYAVVTGGAL